MTRKQKRIYDRWIVRGGMTAVLAMSLQTMLPLAGYAMKVGGREGGSVSPALYGVERGSGGEVHPIRVLRKSEMQNLRGRGRMPGLAGQAKWDVVDGGVNLRTRNFTYTANDLTLPGAVGIPVSVVRTWNANDSREGPFGKGWSWSVDVRQAAGGLIRRKASPVRTVPTQLNNGRRLITISQNGLQQREVKIHDGTSFQDASGSQWLAWRDADGLYTPPPWDHNEYESQYQTIAFTIDNTEYEREYALSTTVTTPDGTVYVYQAVIQPDGKPALFDAEGNEIYAEQVLTSVQDRHGNTTTYHYVEREAPHTYYDKDGNEQTAQVRKAFVDRVVNAKLFELSVTWNFEEYPNMTGQPRVIRVQSLSPSSQTVETIHYDYPNNDWSKSVSEVRRQLGTNPPQLLASYGYIEWNVHPYGAGLLQGYPHIRTQESDLLSTITDADSVTTVINYNSGIHPDNDGLWYAVAVSSVNQPTGQTTTYAGNGSGTIVRVTYQSGTPCIARQITFTELPSDFLLVEEQGYEDPWQDGRHERTFDKLLQNLQLDEWIFIGLSNQAGTPVCDPPLVNTLPPFAGFAQREDLRTVPIHEDISSASGNLTFLSTSYPSYNCFGQPLQVVQTAKSLVKQGNDYVEDTDSVLTQNIQYHGKEYYYQKHREQDPMGRWVRYQYFDRNAAQGYKGQLQAVYAENYSNSQPLSQVIQYNAYGQPVLTAALQKVDGSGNPARWVYTKTFYEDQEGEGDDATGQPQKVIEDYRYASDPVAAAQGVNRINTTRYDSFGRAWYQSTYSRHSSNPEYANPNLLVRRLRTTYHPNTGQVTNIDRVNKNNLLLEQLTSYTYTPGGRVLTANDHFSKTENVITYQTGTGKVLQTDEYWQNELRYRMEYTYGSNNTAADLTHKELTIYTTGQAPQTWKWDYKNFVVGYTFPLNRVFTRVITTPPVGVNLPYPIVTDYVYDWLTMRLRATRFNVVPDPNRGTEYLDAALKDQRPLNFAFAWYVYDPQGRITDLRYYRADRHPTNVDLYTYSPLSRFEYFNASFPYMPAYNAVGSRQFMRGYSYAGSNPQLERTESYQYDALDRLISTTYGPNGSTDSWTYDVMGNRSNSGQTWNYDGLNRITSRPGASYTHDLLGNRLTDSLYSYNWDSTNRLIGMTPWNTADPVYSFVYRADGLRIKKVKQAQQDIPIAEMLESGPEQLQGEDEEMKPVWIGHETNYLYDGQMPVCEQDFEDGVLKQTRIHLLGARGIEGIITVPATGAASLNWLLYDGHGNMVRTMNTSFALSGFQWRGVWGEQTTSTPGRGYCANLGHPEDETGLVYMRARYYEPGTGRFISEDPARDGVNWYLYADGDPVNRVDSEGKDALTAAVGLFFIALGMFSLYFAASSPSVAIAYNELIIAYNTIKKIWADFTFGVMLNIGVARAFGQNILVALPGAVINAFAAAVVVAAEMGLLAAAVPGAWRAALAIYGALMTVIGMTLLMEHAFGGAGAE